VAKELARSLSWKVAGSGVETAEKWSCCVCPALVEGMPTAATNAELEHAVETLQPTRPGIARAQKDGLTTAITSEPTEIDSAVA
jgi:hypothetical protein